MTLTATVLDVSRSRRSRGQAGLSLLADLTAAVLFVLPLLLALMAIGLALVWLVMDAPRLLDLF